MPETLRLAVRDTADVERARRECRALAVAQGFTPLDAEALALAVSELATNLARYAVGGEIIVSPVARPESRGLQIESVDNGPGIPDVGAAMEGGHSSSGSLGEGLGVIRRHVDEFTIDSTPAGTHILIRKWHADVPQAEPGIMVYAATRPFPGEVENGDAWNVTCQGAACRVAVIDGLGHGPGAAEAARAATAVLAANPQLDAAASLRLVHSALGHTRGAVAAIATVDPATNTLTFGGVGNVEARLWQAGQEERLISYRGVLGATLPTLRTFTYHLETDWWLVFYTDGISARFALQDEPAFLEGMPSSLADALVRNWGRETDDATAVVIRPRPAPGP